nr:septin-7-like [Manis javanica]
MNLNHRMLSLKRLHEKVNIISLIAKADTLTREECQQFKKQIRKEIQEHKIKIYEFPESDEEENKLVKKIKDRLPLAVVGSNTIIEFNGERMRGRQCPWGAAEIENGEHCDFTSLRNMLIRTHTQDLKDVTNNVHYENYWSRKLAAMTYNGVDNDKNKGQLTKSPLAQMEEEKRAHVAKMKKMEMEMEQVFEMMVKEKIQELDSEPELQRHHEQMKKNLEAQHKELEEKCHQFEDEKANLGSPTTYFRTTELTLQGPWKRTEGEDLLNPQLTTTYVLVASMPAWTSVFVGSV